MRYIEHIPLLALLSSVLLTGCGNRQEPLTLVDHVDIERMAGTWYVTHHIPYWLERGKVATKDVYTLRDDGRIDVAYVFRRNDFAAAEESWEGISWVVKDDPSNAHWKVRFWWPFTFDYLVIDRDPNYAWVVIGNNSRKYFWILAREPQLAPEIIDGIFDRAEAQGYDRTQFAAVPQIIPTTTADDHSSSNN